MTELTQCVADGGLINPALFPARSADLDVSAISGSGSSLRSMGQAVSDKTGAIQVSWVRLGGCYEAPEQDRVYTLLNPAVASAGDLDSRFGEAARLLDTYGHAVEGIKPRLADLEQRAASFRAAVVNGVQVDASDSAGAGFGDQVRWAFDWVPGVDQDQVTVPWNQDGGSVEKNNQLLEEYAQILSDISAAAATCANGVNGLVTNVCVAPSEAIPAEAFTSGEVAMPWGAPAVEDRNCRESFGHGAAQFGTSFAQGVGMLVVGYNPQTGGWFEGSAYGQAWGGLGDLAGSLALMASPAGWVAAGMAATGNNDNGFSDFMYDRAVVVRNAGGALVGWDPNAPDGWHKWSEDGVAAGTESLLNIGTFFIPGAGEVGGGVKAASIGARVVKIAGVTSEFVVQGGSWVIKGGIKVVTHIGEVSRRFDLGEFIESVRPRMVVTPDGMRVPVIRGPGPDGWFNAMNEHPNAGGHGGGDHSGSGSGGSGPSKPITDGVFGGGKPTIDLPPVHMDPKAAPPGGHEPTDGTQGPRAGDHSHPVDETPVTGHDPGANGTHDPAPDPVGEGPASHDPGVGHGPTHGGVTHPSREPDLMAEPRGERASDPRARPQKQLDLKAENMSADVLARHGYDIEQNPPTKPNGKNPDYLIEGKYADAYHPNSIDIEQILKVMKKKVKTEQCDFLVLNLDSTTLSPADISAILARKPIPNLTEVLATIGNDVVRIFP